MDGFARRDVTGNNVTTAFDHAEHHGFVILAAFVITADEGFVGFDVLARTAKRGIKFFARMGIPLGNALAHFFRAGLVSHQNDHAEASALLRVALELFEQAEFPQYAAAARYRLGEQTGGANGEVLKDQARDWFRAQGARRVDRMVDLIAAGFAAK